MTCSCGFVTADRDALVTHFASCLGPSQPKNNIPPEFEHTCHLCTYGASKRTHIEEHLARHAKGPPYRVCSDCGVACFRSVHKCRVVGRRVVFKGKSLSTSAAEHVPRPRPGPAVVPPGPPQCGVCTAAAATRECIPCKHLGVCNGAQCIEQVLENGACPTCQGEIWKLAVSTEKPPPADSTPPDPPPAPQRDWSDACVREPRPVASKKAPKQAPQQAKSRSTAFACLTCGKRFAKRATCKKHEAEHAAARSCAVCGHISSTGHNLISHIVNIHLRKVGLEVVREKGLPPRQRCRLCGAIVEDADLRKHVVYHQSAGTLAKLRSFTAKD